MDASARTIMGLISETNVRFVVPVYQRPYSWTREQCVQLWEDVLACGRVRRPHFTGSIVTIRDGLPSEAGVTSLLLIDGQQRIATIMLLLVALARHAVRHPNAGLAFSRDEIVEGGYLTNRFRSRADHCKLTLSKQDREVFLSLVDNLEHPESPVVGANSRLMENLAFFERQLCALRDVDSVWVGLAHLEVVSVALSQGHDNPQLIFESMNSTGKDLTSADLIRNFVLMSFPVSEQKEIYRMYWGPIEHTLGRAGEGFDKTFDAFVRSYLVMADAPEGVAGDDVYHAFKRHVLTRGYGGGDRMRIFSLRLGRFARYYVAATTGETDDVELSCALKRIARLRRPVVVPLLLALLDGCERGSLSRANLLRALSTIEGYLVRRIVCDCEGSVLPAFFASLIARLDAVRGEGADVADALEAMLLNEQDTSRRLPSDAEFAHSLRVRDMYSLPVAATLLARLEDTLRGDGCPGIDPCAYIVERVLPPHALRNPVWRAVLGDDAERALGENLNALGNMTLTPYDFELQDASLAGKQARMGAADGQAELAISQAIVEARSWDLSAIAARTSRLTELALRTWRRPQLAQEVSRAYRATGRARPAASASFTDLFEAGLVQMDDALVSVSPLYPGRATVTSRGKIMLADGRSFDDPTEAYARFLASIGAVDEGHNGWLAWRVGDGGPILDDLRLRLG